MSPSAPFDIVSGDAGIAGLAEYSDPGYSCERRQDTARKCARGEALQELLSTTDQEHNAAIDRRIGSGRRSPEIVIGIWEAQLLKAHCSRQLASKADYLPGSAVTWRSQNPLSPIDIV